MSALEFTRLHEAVSNKGGKTKGGKSTADAQTGAAIAHALKENWGFRDVALYVNKAISALYGARRKEGPRSPARTVQEHEAAARDLLRPARRAHCDSAANAPQGARGRASKIGRKALCANVGASGCRPEKRLNDLAERLPVQ